MHEGEAMSKIFAAVGLMSGTSMDGIDAAVIRTDGEGRVERGLAAWTRPYERGERQRLQHALTAAAAAYGEVGADRSQPLPARQAAVRARLADVERELTDLHATAVEALLREAGLTAGEIDVVGLHGHTVLHRPDQDFTLQLGDASALAGRLGIPVVGDLRSRDLIAGGQGAPLVPAYHRALVRSAGLELPVAVVNVGGVANVTYVGADDELIAFDTGPGNALIDDWMALKTGQAMDCGGACARGGKFSEKVLGQLLSDPYFSVEPPKSLDRNHFKAFALPLVEGLSPEFGARTLTVFTVMAVARADFFFPMPPRQWIICGGGIHNQTMMEEFRKRLEGEVRTADELGWSADFMEAEAFGYLAVRSLRELPLTFPGTTGVPAPQPGGILLEPR
jgi:anhydro-N-acetylmuramic acid kinase